MLFCFYSQESRNNCILSHGTDAPHRTASWPAGDHILWSFSRKVFHPLFNKMFSKLRVSLREDTEELKK